MGDNDRKNWSVGSYSQEGRRASGLEGKQFDAQIPTAPPCCKPQKNAADPYRRNADGAATDG